MSFDGTSSGSGNATSFIVGGDYTFVRAWTVERSVRQGHRALLL